MDPNDPQTLKKKSCLTHKKLQMQKNSIIIGIMFSQMCFVDLRTLNIIYYFVLNVIAWRDTENLIL